MGCRAQVLVVGDPALADVGEERIHALEARWSRFLEDSDVTRANRSAGWPVEVSDDTLHLAERAKEAQELTAGAFNPLLGAQLATLGYDRDFVLVPQDRPWGSTSQPRPSRDAPIEIDRARRTIRVPDGCAFDPGGIGKGLAADLAATALIQAGAEGALVNLGGDLRVTGSAPDENGWILGVDDPFCAGAQVLQVALRDGAIATSSRLHRRWSGPDGDRHHLLEPRTGQPARTPIVAVTVVAASGWAAEAVSKAVFVHHPSVSLAILDEHGVDGMVTLEDRTRLMTPMLQAAAC